MACEPHKNPLQRSGIGQADRLLPGLSPDHVRIDERDIGDWVVFAAEYSRWLRFHQASGDVLLGWQAFFARDVSAVLGGFAVQDIEAWRTGVRERLDFLLDDANAADDAGLKRRLGELLGAAVTLSKALDDYLLKLPPDLPFKGTLRNLVKVRLAPAFRKLLGYQKGAQALGLYQAVTSASPAWNILNRPLTDGDDILRDPEALTPDWWDPPGGIHGLADIPPDESVFGDPGTVFARVSHAAGHFLFTSGFDQFTEAFARLIADAEKALADSLTSMDGHKPHYALFLAFLRLFRNAQGRLNGILWRHLDFYYKDILRLRPQAPEPDHVHLVAELAKAAPSASLPQGALFKAGKDSLGRDVVYALDRETTFNKAVAAEFKAVYRVDPSEPWEDGELAASGRYFAAPAMASADGLGAGLLTPFKEWHPFLNKTADAAGTLTAVNMPPARIGFAVASHYLFLAEGARTIKLRFGGTSFASFPKEQLACYLTWEKGWLETAPSAVRASAFTGGGACTEIEIRLSGTDPAVVAWNAKVHGGAFARGGAFAGDVPVAQCVLRNEPGEAYGLDGLKNVSVTALEVLVQVGTPTGAYDATGVKQVFLGNANGSLDPSKPFMPWGAVPEKDSPLVVGSKEIFSKRNAAFNLHLEWANRPATVDPSPGAKLQFLEGGVWKDNPASLTSGKVCSGSQQRTFAADVTVPAGSLVDYRDPYAGLTPSARGGCMRLLLTGNFGQEAYAAAQLAALISSATGGTLSLENYSILETALSGNFTGKASAKEEAGKQEAASGAEQGKFSFTDFTSNFPTKPYLPVIGAVYLSYTAASGPVDLLSADPEAFAGRQARLYHLGPFGEAEQDFPVAGSSGHYLLPQFRHPDGIDHVGEWLIGFRDLAPRQSVEALFQLLEGSTVPTLSKPEQHVTWSYWAGNRWVAFEERDVSDATRQLVQSGIIRFAIPADATVDKGVLPHGLVWVMASVTAATGAVCQVLSVQAQAMRATFADRGNAPDWLDTPLPAGTIGKLKDADARFKKFAQPYPSFGGRPAEGSGKFYLRSSERLRHKGRAVTLWDYETLVLEAFPGLYKVKCLNHTRIEDNPDSSLAVYSENAPGHVAIIAIPALGGLGGAAAASAASAAAASAASAAAASAASAAAGTGGGSLGNPLKPFAGQDVLTGIKEYLRERVTGQLSAGGGTPGVFNLHVCNPLFEEISLEFHLQLKPGFEDFAWYSQLLQEEIMRHLSPWAFPAAESSAEARAADVQFGGRISKSSLINFIEERPYVDFITSVDLRHRPGDGPLVGNLEEAVASTARSILVSAPAAGHIIRQYGT